MPHTRLPELLLCGALALPGCRTAPGVRSAGEPVDDLGMAWLSGTWVMDGKSRRNEENWTTPDGGTMFGVSRTIAGGKTVDWEFLRIERTPEGVVYFASPRGRTPPTPFTRVESSDRRAAFENRAHDFPRRIIYERTGNRLDARLEGVEDGQPRSEEWSWRLAVK